MITGSGVPAPSPRAAGEPRARERPAQGRRHPLQRHRHRPHHGARRGRGRPRRRRRGAPAQGPRAGHRGGHRLQQAAAQLKQFVDGTGGLWAKGLLADKVYSAFTSAATEHGGNESTLLGLNNVFIHWGGIIVAPGYTDPVKFADGNPYGTSHTSNDGQTPPTRPR